MSTLTEFEERILQAKRENLTELDLSHCAEVADLHPLSSLVNLTELDLWGCTKVADLAPLSSLVNLTKLSLSRCSEVADLRPLSSLVNLTELNLSGCTKVKDLRPLSSLVNLTELNLWGCTKVADLAPLSSLVKLTMLLLPSGSWLSPTSRLIAIHLDAEGRPHNEKGPSVFCENGWNLYYWHGVEIPGEWITGSPPSVTEALAWESIEQRRAACEIVGWVNILKELSAKVINEDGDPEIGTLLEADIPGSGLERFLKVRCGTGRDFVLPVPPHVNSALEANAWTWGLDGYEYRPDIRT